jgi:hypothetical protein
MGGSNGTKQPAQKSAKVKDKTTLNKCIRVVQKMCWREKNTAIEQKKPKI